MSHKLETVEHLHAWVTSRMRGLIGDLELLGHTCVALKRETVVTSRSTSRDTLKRTPPI